MTNDDDVFTEDERRALAAWDAPSPPAGFAGRVVQRAADRGSPGRAAAVAVLVIVGGIISAQLLSSRLPSSSLNDAYLGPSDAGPAEVSPSRDGVRS